MKLQIDYHRNSCVDIFKLPVEIRVIFYKFIFLLLKLPLYENRGEEKPSSNTDISHAEHSFFRDKFPIINLKYYEVNVNKI